MATIEKYERVVNVFLGDVNDRNKKRDRTRITPSGWEVGENKKLSELTTRSVHDQSVDGCKICILLSQCLFYDLN